MNKKSKEQINSFFNKDLPEPDMNLFEQIKSEISDKQTQKQSKNLSLKFKWLVSCITIIAIILPSIFVAIFFSKDKTVSPIETPPTERYYTSSEVNKVAITDLEAENFVSENYPKYSFIFDECTLEDIFKYEFEGKIVAISFYANEIETPLRIDFKLLTDNYYNYDDDPSYKNYASIEEKENYTLYYTERTNMYITNVYELFEYSDYRLYINFNYKDDVVINKFL